MSALFRNAILTTLLKKHLVVLARFEPNTISLSWIEDVFILSSYGTFACHYLANKLEKIATHPHGQPS